MGELWCRLNGSKSSKKRLVLILIRWFQWRSSLQVISWCFVVLLNFFVRNSLQYQVRSRKKKKKAHAVICGFSKFLGTRVDLCCQNLSLPTYLSTQFFLVQEDVNVFQDFGKEPKLFRVTSEAVQKSLAFRLILALQVTGAWWCSDPRGQGQWNGSSPSFSTHLWNPSFVT